MITYREFLAELSEYADAGYRDFHKKLLKNDSLNVLGVRIPQMRKIAKKYVGEIDNILTFPDEYYDVTFIKLAAVSYLKWEKFICYVDDCVKLIDNWATCDCFTPKCIKRHREEFLPYIERYLKVDSEFYQRFALTTLLHYYCGAEYADYIFDSIKRADTDYYYVHMAAAWLVAEMLVKDYQNTVNFLLQTPPDKKTHNKAIQKACESYRLSAEQKTYLKQIKR